MGPRSTHRNTSECVCKDDLQNALEEIYKACADGVGDGGRAPIMADSLRESLRVKAFQWGDSDAQRLSEKSATSIDAYLLRTRNS
jgi:hypothetical protein